MADVLVVGAGIGGLTVAVALARAGWGVDLVERAPQFAAVGAGIVLAANAGAVLAALGVDLAAAGHPLAGLDVLDPAGRALQRFSPGALGEGFGPMYSFHRPELHALLAQALPAGVRVRLGTTVLAVEDDGGVDHEGGAVRARLSDGTTGEWVLLVGADGLRSEQRARVHGELPLRYAGETCWRAIAEGVSVERAAESWGVGFRMGVVPLTRDRVYVFLTRQVATPGAPSAPDDEVLATYAGLGGPCPAALAALRGVPLLHHDLFELDAPVWGRGRTWLLGDAAHGMTPNQGQGAAMAIEDAAALVTALGAPGPVADVEARHRAYVAARHERVRRVQLDSRRLGEVAGWTNPVARTLRDLAMAAVPDSAGAAHMRRLVSPGVALARALAAGPGAAYPGASVPAPDPVAPAAPAASAPPAPPASPPSP